MTEVMNKHGIQKPDNIMSGSPWFCACPIPIIIPLKTWLGGQVIHTADHPPRIRVSQFDVRIQKINGFIRTCHTKNKASIFDMSLPNVSGNSAVPNILYKK